MQPTIVGGDVTWMRAREAFLQYRDLVREGRATEDDEVLMKSYRAIAQGKRILDLRETMKHGGVDELARPRLAIARCDAPRTYFSWDNSLWTYSHRTSWYAKSLATGRVIGFRRDVFPTLNSGWQGNGPQGKTWTRLSAPVPPIPAQFRPRGGLSAFHIVWEVEWDPIPPGDPILLRRLGGYLFAVVAQWDLTDLERAVLGARLS